MLEPFTIKNRHGQSFQIVCQRHQGLCWRCVISNSSGQEVGDLLFEPQDTASICLQNFNIFSEFAGQGLGTGIINKLQELLRKQGFVFIFGTCKTYDRPLSEKEKLAQWYVRLGFTVVRENKKDNPGYIGELSKNLRANPNELKR
jgi:GNAT superfamily N-acetyltransferase